jgi:hypothetical protein
MTMALSALIPPKWLVIDPQGVQCGDIILSARKAAGSMAIRLATRGRYSHAAIVLGGGLYAEAVGFGVRARPIGTIVATRLTVLRLDPGRRANARAIAERAAARVEEYLLAEYWVSSALFSLFSAAPVNERSALFCSHLVTQVYAEAGFDIVPQTSPDKTTPQSIAGRRGRGLRDVTTAAVLRPAHVQSYFLDCRLRTASDIEAITMQGAFADMIGWFDDHGLPRPGRWYHLIQTLSELRPRALQLELNDALSEKLTANDYSRLPVRMYEEAIEPLQRAAARIGEVKLGEPLARMEYSTIRSRRPALQKQTEIQKDNSQFYARLFEQTRLSTFEMLHLHAEVLSLSLQRALEAVDHMAAILRKRYRID